MSYKLIKSKLRDANKSLNEKDYLTLSHKLSEIIRLIEATKDNT